MHFSSLARLARRAHLSSLHVHFVRGAFFVLPLCGAAWAAGCSDSDGGAGNTTGDAGDASPDTFQPPPQKDAAVEASAPGRDCSKDLDADGIWEHLECSGLYDSFANKTVSADAKPYKPGVEFWSDGAEKLRWIFLPPNMKIDISNFDEWQFPVGTKLWKEFKLQGKRVETRLFTKTGAHMWAHTSYRWTADESDAVRKDGGELVPGIGPNGATYEVPSTGQCDECHNGRVDQILGFEAVQLGIPTATGQTLATLAAAGLLSATPPKTTLTFPEDTTGANTASKAIGWIHANCGMCHNANPNAAALFAAGHFLVRATDLTGADGGAPATVQDLDLWKTAYCQVSSRLEPADAGGGTYLYIRGGDPSRSLMSVLSGERAIPPDEPSTGTQMPPIVTRSVDNVGHQLFVDWITALPVCP